MRIAWIVVVVVSLGACKGKQQEAPAPADKAPVKCPAGQVDNGGTCVAVVTHDAVAAVTQQQSRIDELAKLLDQVEVVQAPIEILDGLRQIDAWKAFAASNDKAKIADEVVAAANNAVKTLRAFKASLGEVSTRLGNLKGELDKLMVDSGATRKLEEVRVAVSAQVKAAIEPFAAQVADTIQNAIVPLSAKLDDVSAIVDIACGTVKLSGGDKAKDLCKDAKTAIDKSTAFLADFKKRPTALFDDVAQTLEAKLGQLIDTETKQLIDAAQAKVNALLALPPKP